MSPANARRTSPLPREHETTRPASPHTTERPAHLKLLQKTQSLPAGAGLQPAIAREMLAAQATSGNLRVQRAAATADPPAKTWKVGSDPGDPVKYDAKSDAYVANWKLGALLAEEQAINLEEAAAEMGKVVDLALDVNAKRTSVSATYQVIQVEHHFLDMVNAVQKELRASETALATREKELKTLQAKVAAIKARVSAASTPEEKSQAEFDLEQAKGLVEMQEGNIEVNKENVAGLQKRIAAAIRNLRLHEKTHAEIAAQAARVANAEIKGVKDLATRTKIVDEIFRIEKKVQDRMDALLNPSVMGSESESHRLDVWTGAKEPSTTADTDVDTDFRTMLDEEIAASRALGWVKPETPDENEAAEE